MALDVGEVRAVLSLDSTQFMSGLTNAFSSIAQVASRYGPEAAVAAAAVVGAAFSAAFAVKVTEGVAKGLKQAFESAAVFEQTQIGFKTLFGDDAASFYPELQQFGVNTPFELKELESYALWMKTARIETEDIIPILTSAGDAAAALGDSSKIEVFVRALIDMKKKGKISAEELTRQIGQVIPAWDYVAESLGVTTQEAMKMAEQGLLDVDDTIQALVDGVQSSNMGGMMAADMETFNGKLAMVRDELELFKRDIGAPLVEAAKPFLDMARDGLSVIKDIVSDFLANEGPALGAIWRDIQPDVMFLVEFGLNMVVEQLRFILDSVVILAPAFALMVQGVSAAVRGFQGLINTYMIQPLNAVIKAINAIFNTNFALIDQRIVGASSNARRGSGGAIPPSSHSVPKLADGGIVTAPTFALIGEAGPEAVIPLSKLGSAGGAVFNITGSRGDAAAIAAEVKKVLRGEVGGARSRTALMGAY